MGGTGSLLVVVLLRTAHYNLAKLKDVYLHTNTLAALANLAPHMAHLSSHAAQRLVSLFDMLSRRYVQNPSLTCCHAGTHRPPDIMLAPYTRSNSMYVAGVAIGRLVLLFWWLG
jgi:hypothetical protein